jgi:AraC-like DNA-binding protein
LERVELARQMILQSPGQDLKVSSLAQVAGISESHFIRLFGDTYGVSPRQMLYRRRMEVACELLSLGKDASEVALAVGYSSLPTFCRRFKEAFGSTPGEFKLNFSLNA